jgi:dynein heavy chain
VKTVRSLLEKYVDKTTAFQKKNCKELVPTDILSSIITLCTLFDALATVENGVSPQEGESYILMIENWFLFSLIWSIGASLDEDGRMKFDIFLREMDPRYGSMNNLNYLYKKIGFSNFGVSNS